MAKWAANDVDIRGAPKILASISSVTNIPSAILGNKMRLVTTLAVALVSMSLLGCVQVDVEKQLLPLPSADGPTMEDASRAYSVDLSKPLSAASLAIIAVYTNPGLRALRAREGVAEAQVFAAGLIPDPSFSIGLDQPLNGVGLVSALASSIGWDLMRIARRPYEVDRASATLANIRFDIVWAEWLTAEQVRILAARVSHLELLRSQTIQLKQFAKAELLRSLRAVSRGDLPASAMEARRLAASDATSRDRSTENKLEAARLALNRLLGIDPSERYEVTSPPNLPLAQTIPNEEDLFRQAVELRADLAGLRAGYAGSNADLSIARMAQYPLPILSINAARDTGNIKTLGPSFSFTLPLWNRGQGDIAVAQMTRKQLQSEYYARLHNVRADIASARSALKITLLQYSDVARGIEPLKVQAEAAERAAKRGDLSLAAAMAMRMVLLDRQIVANELALASAELKFALEIASGKPLEWER